MGSVETHHRRRKLCCQNFDRTAGRASVRKSGAAVAAFVWASVLAVSLERSSGAKQYSVNLTRANWVEATTSKTVFIKYATSWCEECKKIETHWQKLAKMYKDDPTIIIGDVNCELRTAKKMCRGLEMYPTIKYGDPDYMFTYYGSLDLANFTAMVHHALEECSPSNIDKCGQLEQDVIEDYMEMDMDELTKKVKGGEKTLGEAYDDFEKEMSRLGKEQKVVQKEVLRLKGAGAMSGQKNVQDWRSVKDLAFRHKAEKEYKEASQLLNSRIESVEKAGYALARKVWRHRQKVQDQEEL